MWTFLAGEADNLRMTDKYTDTLTRMKEINPQKTTRAYAFEMWMNAPMPMLTFFKAMDL